MPHVANRYDPSLGPSDLLRHVSYEEAQRLELNAIPVDTMTTVDDLTGRVAEVFEL